MKLRGHVRVYSIAANGKKVLTKFILSAKNASIKLCEVWGVGIPSHTYLDDPLSPTSYKLATTSLALRKKKITKRFILMNAGVPKTTVAQLNDSVKIMQAQRSMDKVARQFYWREVLCALNYAFIYLI